MRVMTKWALIALLAAVSLTAQARVHHVYVTTPVALHSGHGGWHRPIFIYSGWFGPSYCGAYGFYGWGYPWGGYCGDPFFWDRTWLQDYSPSGQPGVTYIWDTKKRRYVPAPVESETQGAMPPSTQLYIYPRQGQDEQKQATDQFECHQWASQQTGFDPTVAATATASRAEITARSMDYRRAMTACLDGRGYSVQ